MNKERVKSVILALLIIFNLLLAENILADKKLWPSGYNFFSIRSSSGKDYSIIGHLTLPEKIFVSTGYQSDRFEYMRNSAEFNDIYSEVCEVLKKTFSLPEKSAAPISSDSWYTALSAKSIYLSYPCRFSARSFSELLGISQTEMNFSGFSDIIIGENGSTYIKDDSANAFFRIETAADLSKLIGTASENNTDDETVINFSFDLNFDKDFGDQKTFLSPMIPIYSAPVLAETLMPQNPIFRDGEINQRVLSNILSVFSINPNTVRRYTEADGTVVFVENNCILKISAQGVLSYTANNSGIALSSSTSDTASIVTAISEFISKVNSAAEISADMCITSPLTSDSVQRFTLDYIENGLPVKYNGKNAASLEIKDGCLAEYTQILRVYEHTTNRQMTSLYIEALDSVIADYQSSMNEIHITKMFPAYLDDLSYEEKLPDWYIDIDNVLVQ